MSLLIGFSGLPGVGKTTVARALSKKIGAVYLRVDSIEAALKSSVLQISPAEDAGYLAAIAVAKDNLANERVVIVDSVNPIALTRGWFEDAAELCDAKLVNIEVVCSSLPEHQRRVERRLKQKNETDLPNWEAVQSRVYEPWTTERIQIDTNGQNVDQSVQQVLLNFPD